MEVVLLENIKNLGQIGDVVNVKRGHGRNFLIKYGKAMKASKENISFVNKKKMNLMKKTLSLEKMQKKFTILLTIQNMNSPKFRRKMESYMDQ